MFQVIGRTCEGLDDQPAMILQDIETGQVEMVSCEELSAFGIEAQAAPTVSRRVRRCVAAR